MKVLFVDRSCADSIWSVLTPVSEKLVEQGWEVCWSRMRSAGRAHRSKPPKGVESADIFVPRDAFRCAWIFEMLVYAPKFRKLLREQQPDIVHTNFAVPGIIARWLGKKHGCQVVSTQHEMYGSMNGLLRMATRATEKYVDVVTYVSKTVAESYGVKDAPACVGEENAGEKHSVVYNSVDFTQLQQWAEGAGERDKSKIVCAGRMVTEKGQRVLLEAMPAVLAEQPEATLHFCGNGPDEDYLKERAGALGIESSIVFHGWVTKEEMIQEMASSGAVVQPSDGSQEGFGLTLLEAMAVAPNVVVSDIPVFREVVGDSSNTVKFVPPRDAAAWASKLVEVMGEHEATSMSMDTLVERFSDEVNACSYFSIYAALVGKLNSTNNI